MGSISGFSALALEVLEGMEKGCWDMVGTRLGQIGALALGMYAQPGSVGTNVTGVNRENVNLTLSWDRQIVKQILGLAPSGVSLRRVVKSIYEAGHKRFGLPTSAGSRANDRTRDRLIGGEGGEGGTVAGDSKPVRPRKVDNDRKCVRKNRSSVQVLAWYPRRAFNSNE